MLERTPYPNLGPLEQQVMEVLWQKSPQDVAQAQVALAGSSAYSTVKTILERLTEKGLLTRQKVGKAFEYSPVLSQAEYQDRQARHLSESLVSGFGNAALVHFVDAVRDDPSHLKELRRLLTELENE